MRPALLVMAIVGVVVAALAVWWLARGEDHSPGPRDETTAPAEDGRDGGVATRHGARDRDPAAAVRPRAGSRRSGVGGDGRSERLRGDREGHRRAAEAGAAGVDRSRDRRASSARGKTGADGRFRIAVGPRPRSGALRGAVQASDDRGRVALASLPDDPATGNEIDAGVLSLGEGAPISVRVVRDGQAVAGARVWFGHVAEARLRAVRGRRPGPRGSAEAPARQLSRDGVLRRPRVSRRRARRRSAARRRRSARRRPRARVAAHRRR